MKIGVISDTHGCVATWRHIFSQFFKNADFIIHAGDVLYHGPRNDIPAEYNPKALIAEINACPIPILVAQGNCDAEVDSMVLDIPITKNCFIQHHGLRVLVQHGHDLKTDEAIAASQRFKLDILVTGHTHIAELYREQNTIFLNPGSPAMTKRDDKLGTFAMIDDATVAIYEARTGKKLTELRINQS